MSEHEPISEGSNFLGSPKTEVGCDEIQKQRLEKERMDRYHDLLLATDDGNVRPEYSPDKIGPD